MNRLPRDIIVILPMLDILVLTFPGPNSLLAISIIESFYEVRIVATYVLRIVIGA